MKKYLLIMTLALLGGVTQVKGYETFQVAGVSALTGSDSNWAQIDLTDEDEDGIYTYTTTKNLTKGTEYKYKYVFDNTDWDVANKDDRTFTVQGDGEYLIIFSVNKANANSYDDKFYACDTYAILQPSTMTFKGMGVTSSSWGGDVGSFTKEGNSWTYTIDETIDNVYFHFIMNGVEYSPSTDRLFNPTTGWTMDMNTWDDYVGGAKSYSLSPLSTFNYSRYVITITPYHNNIYMVVTAYEKATTNAYGYCTYVNTNPLTIPASTAYYATDDNDGSATAHAIENPAANTPMLIKGKASTTYYFDVAASGTDYSGTNAFKQGSGSAVLSSVLVTEGDYNYNYILNGNKFYAANGMTVAVNKAYLQLSKQADTGANARILTFPDDETAAVHAITAEQDNDSYYNLHGVKVAQPTKGLYIHNGKKLIVK